MMKSKSSPLTMSASSPRSGAGASSMLSITPWASSNSSRGSTCGWTGPDGGLWCSTVTDALTSLGMVVGLSLAPEVLSLVLDDLNARCAIALVSSSNL
ncbi:hypothetical protein BDV39DRAFT_177752 [Aspergillus sergii]|uniref:Uncharacterized protein n=1 Tax=Aspergillus sergii TaxID=1034303 RepID=A0A5N6WZH5_9EURO|nr:hypothetical protein BDV39DRAFT_177752 [Aspergillus sergii]